MSVSGCFMSCSSTVNGIHVRARLSGVHDVERVADGRGEHLRLEALDAVDLAGA